MLLLHWILGQPVGHLCCRLCLNISPATDGWSHLDRSLKIASLGTTVSLRSMLDMMRNGHVYHNTSLPQSVCDRCVNATLQSFLFRKQCERSEKQFELLTEHLFRSSLSLEKLLTEVVDDAADTDKPIYILKGAKCKQIVLPKHIVDSDKTVCKYISHYLRRSVDGCDFDVDPIECYFSKSEFSSIAPQKNKHQRKFKAVSFICAHCSLTFARKKYLVTHLKVKHNVVQLVECNECNKKFTSVGLLRKHVSVHKALSVYKCSRCQEIFNKAKQLEAHVTKLHNEKKYKCPECPEIFYRVSDTKKHQMRIHNSGHDNICKQCGKKFQSLKRLKNHEEKHKGVICEKCDQRFAFPYKLQLHLNKCTVKGKSKELSKTTVNKAAALGTNHTQACKLCNRTFTSAARLQCHLSRHSRVVCDKCGRLFRYQSQLKTHINLCPKDHRPGNPRPERENVGPPQYVCDHCGRDFHFKESLKAHIKSQHLFHNLYGCNFCDRKFSYKGGLTAHLVVHTRKRSEQCNVCGKYFVTKPALVYHTRLHTGERPFACDMCDEKFISASRRMAHIRTKHWGRTEECNVCSSRFYTPYAMRKHLSRHFNPKSKLFCTENVVQG